MRLKSRTHRNTVSSLASLKGPEIAFAIASPRGTWESDRKSVFLLPNRANAFGFQALDRVQNHAPRPRRVRRQVEAAEHAMDEQASGVEHLLELREGVRADRRGEFPCPLPVDDHLAGLEPPPEQVERGILKDDGAVVPRLPTLRGQPRHEAVAVEQLHEELPPRPERARNAPQDLTVLCRSVEVSERREHRDRRIEGVAVWEAAHVPLDERRLDAGVARGLAGLREERGGEVEARHAIPALRQLDRVSTGAARDTQDSIGLPKSSAIWGTSVAITRCFHPIAFARTAAARSLSITASTPTSLPSLRITGIPPPPAAITRRPSPLPTSVRMMSFSMTSTGRGDGTIRRQPPRWS